VRETDTNLVFIAVDTLRSDRMSGYGYPRAMSPNIDALAERGVLFEHCFSVGNCTHPGFTAMLTGTSPESSGIVSHRTGVDLPDDVPMMAEYFVRAGFGACAVDNLDSDPEEYLNLADFMPDKTAELDDCLDAYIAKATGGGPDPLVEQPVTRVIEPRAAA